MGGSRIWRHIITSRLAGVVYKGDWRYMAGYSGDGAYDNCGYGGNHCDGGGGGGMTNEIVQTEPFQ
jgi:hypothetical protein